jgi:hypothetical protein
MAYREVQDNEILHLLKLMLTAFRETWVPRGSTRAMPTIWRFSGLSSPTRWTNQW